MIISTDDLESNPDIIIQLAWADDVSFAMIEKQYGLNAEALQKFMRRHQSEKTYRRWRQRVDRFSSRWSKINRDYKLGNKTKGQPQNVNCQSEI